jgi:hypothetical protein
MIIVVNISSIYVGYKSNQRDSDKQDIDAIYVLNAYRQMGHKLVMLPLNENKNIDITIGNPTSTVLEDCSVF